MPVWHDSTRDWARANQVALLGVTQEQHPERCRLFAQWKQFDWPILHDPINVLGSEAVPLVLAIDEFGIVRSTRPNPKTFAAEFLDKTFADDAREVPPSPTPKHPARFEALKADAESAKTALAWRRYGDALALWGGGPRLADAIEAYRRATALDPKDGPAWFRLGVQLRRRYESPPHEADDFGRAVEAWGTALALDPNQYIWRRRIQQYGPRLEKPYPFYDWVADAEAAVRQRGETPVPLPVRPDGAEVATPLKAFATPAAAATNPDPDGKIQRDPGAVVVRAVVVPAQVKPGDSARVHLTFRPIPGAGAHWNNEADPLRIWVAAPAGVQASDQLLGAPVPKATVSAEERTLGFEVKIPGDARGTVRVPCYALYHLCDAAQGECRFRRQDVTVEIPVRR